MLLCGLFLFVMETRQTMKGKNMKEIYNEVIGTKKEVHHMLTQKQLALVNCLLIQDEPLQMEDLAGQLNISSRTVQRYIEIINQELKQYNCEIVLKRGDGYELQNPPISLVDKLEEQQDVLEDPKARTELLILHILDAGVITLDELSDVLSVSSSLLTKVTTDIKDYLKKYQLELISKPHYGLQILGKELNIRTLLSDIGFQYYQTKLVKCNLLNITSAEFDYMDEIIFQYLSDNAIIVADRDIYELLIRVAISLSRSRSGNIMHNLSLPKGVRYHNFQMIYRIMSVLAEEFKIALNEEEYNYVSIYSGFMIYSFDPQQIDVEKDLHEFVYETVQEISLISGVNYVNNDHVINALAVHLKVLLNRLKKNMKLKNPLLDQIKKDYPMEMNYAIYLTRKVEERFGLKINEEEIGYFAVHFSAHKEKMKDKRRVVILCDYGIGTSQLIGERIRQEINGIEIVGIYPVHYLELALAQDVDIIISTIPITAPTGDKKVIVVDNLLAIDAFDKIKNSLEEHDGRKHLLINLFKKEAFFRVSLNNKQEVFKVLESNARDSLHIPDDVIKAIEEREQVSATDIGNLVAIPHAICEGDFESCIMVTILEKPILWEKEMVQVIFVICFNQKDRDNAALFRELYRCIKSMKTIRKMIDSQTFEEFISLIQ
jgi:lichenan operon transcriptional antiterminator